MRVLQCIPSMEGGGAERQLAYLADALSREGCEIHVALTRGGENLARLEASGAKIHLLDTSSTHDPRLFTRLRRTMAEVQPALVHCWLLQMELMGGMAATMSGVPWVFSERSSIGAYPPTVKNYLRVRAAAFASAIVSNSMGGDEYWAARQRAVRRYIISNALPFEEIRLAPSAARESAAHADDVSVLYAGRLDAGKNADVLVRALARIRSTSRVRAVLCGDGPRRTHIEQLISECGLQGGVRLDGYVSDLWSRLKSATMLVSPSRFEGSPNVVLEAMACRCPLIVSDIPAHREILDDRAALFADPNDAGAFADRIVQTIARPEAAAERARIAQLRAERYDLPQVALQYLTVYRDVLARRARRSLRVA
jgi:glycosyltransferase involved in cell wall biosynthesis